MFYMHLKYDHKLFRALFIGPLIIAVITLIALMFLFGQLVRSVRTRSGMHLLMVFALLHPVAQRRRGQNGRFTRAPSSDIAALGALYLWRARHAPAHDAPVSGLREALVLRRVCS